ncbi:MAG: hypothetical protein ACRDJH_21590 [Thermomicrobiales bacterium]
MTSGRRIGWVTLALILSAVIVGRGSAQAQEATPAGSGSPQAFVRQLLTTPYSGETPAAGEQAVIAVWNDPAYQFLDETVGAAQVIFPRLPFAALSYRVYPDAAAAVAALQRDTTENAPTDDATVSTPDGFDGMPSALVAAGDESICIVQVDNVLVTARAEDGALPDGLDTVALAAMLVGHLDNVLAGGALPATPVLDGPLVGIDPWTLNERLLTEPFAMNELPAGFTDARIEAWTDYNDGDLRGVVGGVLVSVRESEVSGIAYLTYPNQDAADFFFTRSTSDSVEAGGTPAAPPADVLAAPATVISYDDYVVCVTQVGYVTVIGAGDSADQAIAMAVAAVDHLERVAGM